MLPEGADYARGRMFMTSDANGAILGAFDAGATEVVVNDSHWNARNILQENLDPRASLIKGFNRPMCMVQGLDESFDAAVFVGYHSCAGTEGGVLNHTLLGKEVQNLFLNGEPIGETRLNSMMAGHYGVPVAFVAGDEAVCREAKMVLGDDLPTYAVKKGFDMFCAECLHPEVTQKGIRDGVAGALRNISARKPYRDGAALHVRPRVELDDDRVDLRVHPDDQEDESAHDRVHHLGPPRGDGRRLRRVHPRAAGRAEGDLQLIDALVTEAQ